MTTALFATAYAAPVQYYWHWNRSDSRIVEVCEHYIKQSWRNRCLIATANGPMVLSLPVESGAGKTSIKDVRLSDHGNWRHLHWNSIESAYNSSPFFEYYADDLRPIYEKRYAFLFDFNEALHRCFCSLLDLDSNATTTKLFQPDSPADCLDLRTLIHPKKPWNEVDTTFCSKPYYQVFDLKYGFQPNLSIMDLLFNMGPEAILYV